VRGYRRLEVRLQWGHEEVMPAASRVRELNPQFRAYLQANMSSKALLAPLSVVACGERCGQSLVLLDAA
jgi:hypothetical protein